MERTMTLDQVRLLIHEHLISSIAPFLGALFSGGLVALGVMCMFLLSSAGQGRQRRRCIAQTYVVLVVTIVLGYQVVALIELNPEAFPTFYEPFPDLIYVLSIVDSLLPVLAIMLTDGLLVWRCFMVQRALGPNNSKSQALFWIIPTCLWTIIIVAGFTVVGLFCAWRECRALSWCYYSIGVAETISLTGNLTLNLFATSYIVIRLLVYKRNLIYVYGEQHPTPHLISIIGILLESSAINVPVAVIAVVQVYTPVIQTNFLPLCIASQAFSSILIIYRVAIDRAFRQNYQRDTQDNAKETDEERVTITTTLSNVTETAQSSCSP